MTTPLTIGMTLGTAVTAIVLPIFFDRATARCDDAQTGFARTFHLIDGCHDGFLARNE